MQPIKVSLCTLFPFSLNNISPMQYPMVFISPDGKIHWIQFKPMSNISWARKLFRQAILMLTKQDSLLPDMKWICLIIIFLELLWRINFHVLSTLTVLWYDSKRMFCCQTFIILGSYDVSSFSFKISSLLKFQLRLFILKMVVLRPFRIHLKVLLKQGHLPFWNMRDPAKSNHLDLPLFEN